MHLVHNSQKKTDLLKHCTKFKLIDINVEGDSYMDCPLKPRLPDVFLID
jgi:hypothetical protein